MADGGERGDEHLHDVPDGAGCAEIWEHLSERETAKSQASEALATESRAPESPADD